MKVIIYNGDCGTLKKAYYDEQTDMVFTEWMTREKFEKITKIKIENNSKKDLTLEY